MYIKLHILRLRAAARSRTMDFANLSTQAIGVYWDESYKTDGGHFLSGFTEQLLIAVKGQQNLICQGWLNTPSKMTPHESIFQ